MLTHGTDIITSIGDSLYSEYRIYVDPTGNSGDFNNLEDAFDYVSILTPRADYPCTVVMRNGFLEIDNSAGPITVPEYVTLIGESNFTGLQPSDNTQDLIQISDNTVMQNFEMLAPTSAAAIIKTGTDVAVIRDVSIFGSTAGVGVEVPVNATVFVQRCNLNGLANGLLATSGLIFAFECNIDNCTVGITGALASSCRSTGCTDFISVTTLGLFALAENIRHVSGTRFANLTVASSIVVINTYVGVCSGTEAFNVTAGIGILNNIYIQSCANGVSVQNASVLISRIDVAAATGTAINLITQGNCNISNCRVESAARAVHAQDGSTFLGINITCLDITTAAMDVDDSDVSLDNFYVGVSTGYGINVNTGSLAVCRGFYYAFSSSSVKIRQVDTSSFLKVIDCVAESNTMSLADPTKVELDLYDIDLGGRRERRQEYSTSSTIQTYDRYVIMTADNLNMTLRASTVYTHPNYALIHTIINETDYCGRLTAPPGDTINGVTNGTIRVPAYGSVTVIGQEGAWVTLENQSINHAITSVSGTTTITPRNKRYWADATSAAFDLTLPASAEVTNHEFEIVKIDSSANIVGVVANGSDTINGAARLDIISQYDSVSVQTDGSGVWIVR